MNALQIMQPRTSENKLDWSKIEHKNFTLPPLFKVFHNVYDISTIGDYSHTDFFYKSINGLQRFGFYKYRNQSMILYTIFHPTELEDMLTTLIDFDDTDEAAEILNREVIPIAECPSQRLLMLGVGEKNADKIYYYTYGDAEPLKLLADNIFEFFKEYHVVIDEVYLSGIKLSQLYRNWNEDFWRVREEES